MDLILPSVECDTRSKPFPVPPVTPLRPCRDRAYFLKEEEEEEEEGQNFDAKTLTRVNKLT